MLFALSVLVAFEHLNVDEHLETADFGTEKNDTPFTETCKEMQVTHNRARFRQLSNGFVLESWCLV